MDAWTPEAIVDAALRIGKPLAIFGACVYLTVKFLDAIKVRWGKK